MSDSLPNSSVAIVEVIRNAVVTHACTDNPFRSSPMVRMAVATMVWSSAARNMPSISPDRIVRICRCDSAPSDGGASAAPVAGLVMDVVIVLCSLRAVVALRRAVMKLRHGWVGRRAVGTCGRCVARAGA